MNFGQISCSKISFPVSELSETLQNGQNQIFVFEAGSGSFSLNKPEKQPEIKLA